MASDMDTKEGVHELQNGVYSHDSPLTMGYEGTPYSNNTRMIHL